jgi:hypothetical protein
MKYKLKEISLDNVSFNKSQLETGVIYNLKYNEGSLEFQSPKMIIDTILKENENQYISLKVLPTQACKSFYLKVKEIETFFTTTFKNPIKSIFHEDFMKIKIPFKCGKPLPKIYKTDSLFNYYNLCAGMEVICLVGIDKVWVNNFDEPSYQLNVKEIMII